MSKDFPKTGEGGAAAPAEQPAPSAASPVAKEPSPADATVALQKRLDAEAAQEKPQPVTVPSGVTVLWGQLRVPASVVLEGVALAPPLDHAKALKLVRTHERSARVNGEPATFEEFSPQHAAAAALHGWPEHEHHEGKPIQLSSDAYKAALHAAFNPVTRAVGKDGKPTGDPIDSHEAAAKGVPTNTDYEPHQPALSPHKGKGL